MLISVLKLNKKKLNNIGLGSIVPILNRPIQLDRPSNNKPGLLFPTLPPLPPLPSLPSWAWPSMTANKPQSSLYNPRNWKLFGSKRNMFSNKIKSKPKSNTNETATTRNIGDVCAGIVAATLAGGNAFDRLHAFANEAIPFYKDITEIGSFLCGNKPWNQMLGDYVKNKIGNKVNANLALSSLFPLNGIGKCASGISEYAVALGFNMAIDKFWNWTRSFDPNDMSGPQGVGIQHFVNKETLFEFRIRFENLNTTIAPAQVVKINSINMSSLFDFRTIRFTGYGFNQYANQIADNDKRSYVNDVIQMEGDNKQIEIRLLATVDLEKSELLWKFSTIDKNTGRLRFSTEFFSIK